MSGLLVGATVSAGLLVSDAGLLVGSLSESAVCVGAGETVVVWPGAGGVVVVWLGVASGSWVMSVFSFSLTVSVAIALELFMVYPCQTAYT